MKFQKKPKKPNFFIVGAPKSGTTAMYSYLRQHPEIFMPVRSEMHYFGSDVYPKRQMTEKEYLSFFSNTSKKRVGEKSVWYLYSKQAAKQIKQFSNNAKIIIMLRNPTDMLYSLHKELLYTGEENIQNFEEALNIEQNRKREKQKEICINPHLFYRDVIKYAEQVKRYIDIFGNENVYVIIFDDFVNNTTNVYRYTLKFLGVNHNFKTELKPINTSKKIRSKIIRNFLKTSSKLIPIRHTSSLKPLINKIVTKIIKWNTFHEDYTPLNRKLHNHLQNEFKPEIKKLSRLLDRDLSFWYNNRK